jgi:hypothetical protein
MTHHVVLQISMNPTLKDLERFHERVGAVSDKFPVRSIVGILISSGVSMKRLQLAANWLNAYNTCPYSTYIVQQKSRTRRTHLYYSKSNNNVFSNNLVTRRNKRKYRAGRTPHTQINAHLFQTRRTRRFR